MSISFFSQTNPKLNRKLKLIYFLCHRRSCSFTKLVKSWINPTQKWKLTSAQPSLVHTSCPSEPVVFLHHSLAWIRWSNFQGLMECQLIPPSSETWSYSRGRTLPDPGGHPAQLPGDILPNSVNSRLRELPRMANPSPRTESPSQIEIVV